MQIFRRSWSGLNRPVRFPRLSLLHRFTLLGIVVTVLLASVFGYVLSQRVIADALEGATRDAAAVVNGLINPQVSAQDFAPGPSTTQIWQERLEPVVGKFDLVRIKVWNPQGLVVYSDEPGLVGRRFAPDDELTTALSGRIAKNLAAPKESSTGKERLLEVYVPIFVDNQIVGAYEIYQTFAPTQARIADLGTVVWGGSLLVFSLLFLTFYGLVQRVSREIQHVAYHDPLTGLPNRRFMREIADSVMARAHRIGLGMALIYLDLDRFQELNDALGPTAGDALLKQVGERLHNDLRAGDMVSRLGGDEFALLVNDVDANGVAEVAKRVLLIFGEPFDLPGHKQKVYVQASLGIALYPEDGADLEELMRAADIALYRAKEDNSGFAFYRPDHDRYTLDRLALQSALHQALKEDDLTLHYQSILDLETGTLERVEALVRWYRVGELVMPNSFIPLAEETGLIRELDRFSIRRALTEAARVGLQVSVNLSPRTLGDPQVVEWVREALTESGLEPGKLCLEITEGSLLTDREQALTSLEGLSRLGVRIALDDFGTGYSSLSYLKHLPVDVLKIDRAFVSGIGKDKRDEEVIRSLISLGHGLGLDVLAEGVETPEQLEWLKKEGCNMVQGFGIARPVPMEILRMAPSSLT